MSPQARKSIWSRAHVCNVAKPRSLMLHWWITQLEGSLQLKQPARFRSSHSRIQQVRRRPWQAWRGACSWPSSNLAFWAAPSTSCHVTSTFFSRNMSMVSKCRIHVLLRTRISDPPPCITSLHLHALCFHCIALPSCWLLRRFGLLD